MMDTIHAIGRLARDQFGVRATVHPHAGGYIEFEDELERLVADLDPALAGLCLDTGHLAYAGMDPVETLRKYSGRLDYIHFKDIDPEIFSRVMGEHIRFFDACGQGVMCPIGSGNIDYIAIRTLLTEIDYGGYITIEQERNPLNSGSILDDLAGSRAFLKRIGF
jgi:inosose dehydratase